MKSESKGNKATPGPWSVLFNDNPCGLYRSIEIMAGDKRLMVTERPRYPSPDPDEQDANARLMAAAPDLLAATKHLLSLDLVENMTSTPKLMAIRRLVRKMEGL